MSSVFVTWESSYRTREVFEIVNGNKAPSHVPVFKWFKRLKQGHENVEYDTKT
jgi:hypothetical protein